MDYVYRTAFVTIINAAGGDSDCGLPGVSVTPWRSQKVAKAIGAEIALISSVKEELIKSTWSSRGWYVYLQYEIRFLNSEHSPLSHRTYQEGLLSSRRLTFTETQVAFQCVTTHTCEALPGSFEVEANWSLFGARRKELSDTIQGFPALTFSRFMLEVRNREYLQRTLSYESDLLSAFMGILRQAWMHDPAIYHFWGLPFSTPEAERRVSLSSTFLRTLTWIPQFVGHNPSLVRRPEFPSWTWAGWRGLSSITDHWGFRDVDLHYGDGFDKGNADAVLRFQDVAGSLRPMEYYISTMEKSWDMYAFRPVLHITGWITEIHVRFRIARPRSLFNVEICDAQGRQFIHSTAMVALQHAITEKWPALVFVSTDPVIYGLLLRPTMNGAYERIGRFIHHMGYSFDWGDQSEFDLSFRTANRARFLISAADIPVVNSHRPIARLNCERRTITLV
jgi:hypothetical protein